MSAELISKNGNEVIVQFTVKLTGSMLNDEQALQQSLNEAGQGQRRCGVAGAASGGDTAGGQKNGHAEDDPYTECVG